MVILHLLFPTDTEKAGSEFVDSISDFTRSVLPWLRAVPVGEAYSSVARALTDFTDSTQTTINDIMRIESSYGFRLESKSLSGWPQQNLARLPLCLLFAVSPLFFEKIIHTLS